MIRISQECGQKWYRKSSWKYRPWFRKLTKRVFLSAKVFEIQEDEEGISVDFFDVEWETVHVGWAFGPIMVHK